MAGPDLSLITNAPNLTDRIMQQQQFSNQQGAAQIDLKTKQNIYATQVLGAASSTGNQNMYDNAKAQLQSSGIDVSGWPQGVADGQTAAKSGQMFQSPMGPLMRAGAMLSANDTLAVSKYGSAEKALEAGYKFEAPPWIGGFGGTGPSGGATTAAPVTGATGAPASASTVPSSGSTASMFSPAPVPASVPPTGPGAAAPLMASSNPPQLSAPMQGPTITGQPIAPPALSAPVSSQTAPASTPPSDYPAFVAPEQGKGEMLDTYNIKKDLAEKEYNAKKAAYEYANAPAQAGKVGESEAAGKNTVSYSEGIAADSIQSQNMVDTLGALAEVKKNIQMGALAPATVQLERLATAAGYPLTAEEKANLTNSQVFTKLSFDIVGAAAKQEGGASRLNAAFSAIKASNPNIQMEPGAFDQLQTIMGGKANRVLQEQSAWNKEKNANPNLAGVDFQRNYIAQQTAAQQQNSGRFQQYNFGNNAPASGQIPSFSSESDPAYIKLPSGARFIDATTGKPMVKR